MQIDLSPPDLHFLYFCVLTLCLYASGLTHLTMAVHVPFIKDQYKRQRQKTTTLVFPLRTFRTGFLFWIAHTMDVTHWVLMTHILSTMSRPPSEHRAPTVLISAR